MKEISKLVLQITYWLTMLTIPFIPIVINDRVTDDMDVRLDSPCIDVMVQFVSKQAYFLMISVPIIWPYAMYRIVRLVGVLYKRVS